MTCRSANVHLERGWEEWSTTKHEQIDYLFALEGWGYIQNISIYHLSAKTITRMEVHPEVYHWDWDGFWILPDSVHLVMTLGSPESLDQPHFVLLHAMYAWKCTPVTINCKKCPRNCIQYPSRTPNCGDDNHQCRGTKTFCDPQQRLVVSCSKNTMGKRAKGYQNTQQMQ